MVFAFDEPHLQSLRLSGKRLVVLTECLADLVQRRDVEVRLGETSRELGDTPLAVTFAPRADLRPPHGGPDDRCAPPVAVAGPSHVQRLTSYSAWRTGVSR